MIIFVHCNIIQQQSQRYTTMMVQAASSRATSFVGARHNNNHRHCHSNSALLSSYFSRSTCEVGRMQHRLFVSYNNNNNNNNENNNNSDNFFAQCDFESLGMQSKVLLQRIKDNFPQLKHPTSIQEAAYNAIRSNNGNKNNDSSITIGAETGSGKTFAYLLPIIDDILQRKSNNNNNNNNYNYNIGYDYCRALILVPNKELVQQVVRMAMGLSGGSKSLIFGGNTIPAIETTPINEEQEQKVEPNDIIRLAIMPGGLKEPMDFLPFRKSVVNMEEPVDIVISTPASIGPLGISPKNIDMFADIETVIIDEADMLLDGGYIKQLENVFLGFKRADRLDPEITMGKNKTQYIFVAATIPDYGLRSVDAYINKKFPNATRITMSNMHNAKHYGLREQTMWIECNNKKERMQQLIQLLQTDPSSQYNNIDGLKNEKIMIFLNSVDDVEGASQALLGAGFNVLPYHAKIPLSERTIILDRFRRYNIPPGHRSNNNNSNDDNNDSHNDDDTVPILVCTDLASRGLDIPNVSVIVQLQFASNVVSHLHRMGRCGRAGQRTGRGIVFYDSSIEFDLVQTIQHAEQEQVRMTLPGDVIGIDNDNNEPTTTKQKDAGKVKHAFSRKRGFRKKRKKLIQKESPINIYTEKREQ